MDVIFRLNQQISDQFYYFFHYLESIPLYVQGITNCISFMVYNRQFFQMWSYCQTWNLTINVYFTRESTYFYLYHCLCSSYHFCPPLPLPPHLHFIEIITKTKLLKYIHPYTHTCLPTHKYRAKGKSIVQQVENKWKFRNNSIYERYIRYFCTIDMKWICVNDTTSSRLHINFHHLYKSNSRLASLKPVSNAPWVVE